MIRMNNDYNRGAFPSILRALSETARESYPGYGTDDWCARAADRIRELARAPKADVWFFPGATQANLVVIAAALNGVQSVVAADTGHIHCHEAASIEATGHKILALPPENGKITAAQVRECVKAYREAGEAEYLTEPGLVYLSFPTEQGTLYSKRELTEISEVCRAEGLVLFVDGARLSYGLGSPANDLTLADFARLADVFYLGGTKGGALFGEALVVSGQALRRRFKAQMKQRGAVLAKGWLLGLQFAVMLESGEYFEAARWADAQALRIREAFLKKGIPLWRESFTNQQFVVLTDEQKAALGKEFLFEEEGREPRGTIVRFCTSWATEQPEVDALIAAIESL